MIAADTSAWIDFGKGADSTAGRRLEEALLQGTLVMPAPVLFELLSAPGLTRAFAQHLRELPRIDSQDGYWERAAELRRAVLAKGLKARAMDCLIAQVCIDEDVALIAADRDFRHFKSFGLKQV